jgi:hypothetical protein
LSIFRPVLDVDGEVAIAFMPSIIGSDPCDFLTAATPARLLVDGH